MAVKMLCFTKVLQVLTLLFGLLSQGRTVALSMHRYFVVRHGETDANAGGVIQGSSDFSRLTDRGRAQAEQVGRAVATLGPMDAVYVSPLTRATDTLSLIRNQVNLPEETVWYDLRELDLHEWEGRDKGDLMATDEAAWKTWEVGNSFEFVVSGYKPLVDVWDRAASVWKRLRESEHHQQVKGESSSMLLVCHGTLGQALLNAALGRDASFFRDIQFPNCGLLEIEWPVGSPTATSWKWHHPEVSDRWTLVEWEKSRQQ